MNRPGKGFTLVEVLLVVVIMASLALILAPRINMEFASPQVKLQRTFEELSEMASEGERVRLWIDQREELKAQKLVFSSEEEGSTWQELDLKWLYFDGKWKAEVKECYFFPDGSCTPWNLSLQKGSDEFPFTITVTCTVYEGRL